MQCKKCGSRNKGYKLKDGSCIPQFSFRAVYETSEDDNISFIYDLYKENIIELEVDKEKVPTPNNNYTFKNPGNHTVYILLNIDNLTSLHLFNGTENLKTIYFSKQCNTVKIKSFKDLFLDCSLLESIDIWNFNTEKVEIMDDMFSGCESLKINKISKINNS